MNHGSDCQTHFEGKTGDFTSEQPMCRRQPGEVLSEANEKYPHDISENPDDSLRGKTDILWRSVNLWQL